MDDFNRLLREFNGNPPAPVGAISRLETDSARSLPRQYADFLRRADGGEGFIGANAYAILWRVEELLRLNQEYEVELNAPGLLLIGSDGGGEAFAIDYESDRRLFVSVPFVGMHRSLIQVLAPNFGEFLQTLHDSE